jgi:thiol-disulfide isomerase/thioredoxin
LPKRLFIVIGLIAVGAAYYVVHRQRSAGAGNAVVLRAGRSLPAPEFSLPTLAGGNLDLASYKGKVILLDFWATWCEPCKEEIPQFLELQNKYRDQGLQIIGVSMDDEPGPVRDFYQRFKMNYPVVMGNAKTAELYGGVLGLPINFLIGRDGLIYKKHIGSTDIAVFEGEVIGLLRKSADSTSPAARVNDVIWVAGAKERS